MTDQNKPIGMDHLYGAPNINEELERKIKVAGVGQRGNLAKLKWKMFFRVFDLTVPEHVEEVEGIYTDAMNTNPTGKSGMTIFSGTSQFCKDNVFRVAIRWGEWTVIDGDKKNG